MTLEQRFLTKVKKPSGEGCWEWMAGKLTGAAKGGRGYGAFWVDGQNRPAHRISYELHRGPIPDGLFVCHSCDNRGCVNPSHLFLGTNSDNVADMVMKGRQTRLRGMDSGRSKLTDADIIAIRSSTDTQEACANRFGVTQSHVSRIRSGEIWRHIEPTQ